MDDPHKITMDRSCVYLEENLNPSDVVSHLLSNYAITDHQMETVLVEKTRREQVRQLIKVMRIRGPEEYNTFTKALTDSDYKFVVEQLESTLTDVCKEKHIAASKETIDNVTDSNATYITKREMDDNYGSQFTTFKANTVIYEAEDSIEPSNFGDDKRKTGVDDIREELTQGGYDGSADSDLDAARTIAKFLVSDDGLKSEDYFNFASKLGLSENKKEEICLNNCTRIEEHGYQCFLAVYQKQENIKQFLDNVDGNLKRQDYNQTRTNLKQFLQTLKITPSTSKPRYQNQTPLFSVCSAVYRGVVLALVWYQQL